MTGVLDVAASCEVAERLDMPSLVRFGTCSGSMHKLVTKVANDRMHAKFLGVQPLADSNGPPFWIRLAEALRPNIVHFTYCGRNPDCSRLLSFALDSASSWFVEFEISVRQGTNGIPCVGLVDASGHSSGRSWASGHIRQDLSRQGQGKLAVSFNPELDTVFSNRLEGTRSMSIEFGTEACHEEISQWRTRTHDADGRRWLHTSVGQWRGAMKAGFLISDRQLTFFRWNARREWCSSRVVFIELPDQVIPAIFLSSCSGYATAQFINLSSSPPEMCTRCDALCHAVKRSSQLRPSDDDDDDSSVYDECL